MRYIYCLFFLLHVLRIEAQSGGTSYIDSIIAWRKERAENLQQPGNWLSLAGLYWLKEGTNSIGSDPSNSIRFPEQAPSHLGTLTLEQDQIQFQSAPDVKVNVDGQPLSNARIFTDHDHMTTHMSWQSLTWHIIHRGNRFGIRLVDSLHPALTGFAGIPSYPVDPDWNLPATFQPAQSGEQIDINNVIGMNLSMQPVGKVRFQKDGKTYELTALDGGESQYFLIFSDKTTGIETYGAGRYLYIEQADAQGNTRIDFNKSYNPPCAFTDFATCLLPPPSNRLDLAITAGEKEYGHH
jgi:uncharacterized protein (DUF1684 family)